MTNQNDSGARCPDYSPEPVMELGIRSVHLADIISQFGDFLNAFASETHETDVRKPFRFFRDAILEAETHSLRGAVSGRGCSIKLYAEGAPLFPFLVASFLVRREGNGNYSVEFPPLSGNTIEFDDSILE